MENFAGRPLSPAPQLLERSPCDRQRPAQWSGEAPAFGGFHAPEADFETLDGLSLMVVWRLPKQGDWADADAALLGSQHEADHGTMHQVETHTKARRGFPAL